MRKERQRSPAPDDLPPFERSEQRSSHSEDKDSKGGRDPRSLVTPRGGSGFTNGLGAKGKVNGLRPGRINGLINGFTNGRVNGLRNGRINGLINGFTNGRVNGLKSGRINGLINGFTNGRVNGLRDGKKSKYDGLVNGLEHKTGLVNGNSFINGFRMTGARRRIPLSKKNSSLRLAVVLAVVAIIIVTPFLLIYSLPQSLIKIDGYFFDWDRAGYFEEAKVTTPNGIDIIQYSTVTSHDTEYGYIAADSNLFMGDQHHVSALYGFFDTDNNPNTGYSVSGIGADTMVEIMGWNGSVQYATASDFIKIADRSDFAGFGVKDRIPAMSTGEKIEFSFQRAGIGNPTAVFASKNDAGVEDVSELAIRYNEPALSVKTDLLLPDVIPVSIRQRVMDLEFTSERGNFTVSQLDFEKLGSASNYRLTLAEGLDTIATSTGPTMVVSPALDLRAGYGRMLSLYVEIGSGELSSSFGIALNSTGVITQSGPVSVDEVQVRDKVAYVSEVPHAVVIDGAFADWKYGFVMADKPNDVKVPSGAVINDPSIDILSYGMFVDQTDVAMYLSVAGKMCNGTLIPKNIVMPVPAQGLPNPAGLELKGADLAGAVIDTDLNPSTGANYSGMLGADYLVFIAGKKGKVITSELYSWNATQGNGTWDYVDSVRAAVDSRQMEIAFNFSDLPLGALDVASVSFFMTDWKEATDFSDGNLPLARWQAVTYSKAYGGILINEVYNNKGTTDWIEFFNTGTTPITLTGWRLYDGTSIDFTFGVVTIQPGAFLVITGLDLSKVGNLRLVDAGGALIDSANCKENGNTKTYSRTGAPPYSVWRELSPPTPGALNGGQIPIPEFSDLAIPMAGILVLFMFFRFRRRRGEDG